MKEDLRGRRLSSDEEVTGEVQNWLKTQPARKLLTEFKNLSNAGTGALKSRGITLKSDISFVSLYLQ
jgi:hypothetical protein